MIGKKINQLATELAPVSTDLTIIGDPISGVSKKITLAQLGAIFSGAVSFYTNLASFPATGDINVIYCAKDTQKLYLWSGSAYVEVFPSQALLDTYQLRSEKGVSNGYASLDSSGKVPISQLPSSIMEYKGTWNAATNTPTLANGTGDTGDVYICNVAGTVNFGAGPITFAVGDYVIYSGSIWQRSSGAVGTVTSVAATITGNAIGITGSPVTTSGTLAFAFAGTGAQYIKGDGTLATFPNTIAQATNLITEVYNSTGATLTKGTIVYINGGQGNLPTVTKALATGDSTSAQTFGVVQADITNNNNGYVVVAGKLSDLDTQAYTEGTQLYLSSTTAGAWTSTKQYAPAHLVYVGVVVRAHPTQGIVEVKIQNGYELDELHNVAAQTPTNNDGLFWESATSLWKNKSIATVLGYTPQAQLNGTGFVKASGTTISYDNSTYVTTDTFQTISASKTFSVGLSLASAGGTNQLTSFINTSSLFSGSGGSNVLGFNSANNIYFGKGLDNGGVLQWNNSAVRYYTLPDATGTIALVGGAGVGTVTSVGLSSATSGVTIGSSPITTSGTITLAIATASGSQQGLLSSTDWTTFNNKQNALTNPVTGTGTTNYLPKFTGTSTIGNSQIFDNGTNVGIGTATPSYKLDVLNGSDFDIRLRDTSLGGTVGILFETANDFSGTSQAYIKGIGAGNSGRSQLIFGTATNVGDTTASTKMTLDASGNLGLGVTPSAWSGFTAFDIGSTGNLASYGSGADVQLNANAYFNGTNWIYKTANNASRFRLGGNQFEWFTATSGTAGNPITFTQAMTLNASGNLSIGNTNDTYKLDVSGTGRFTGTLSVASNAFAGTIDFGTGIYKGIMDYTAGSGLWKFNNQSGGSVATDYFQFQADGTAILTMKKSGAATFSSSVTATELYLSTSNGLVGNINSSNANGGYITWQTSGTTIADIGTANQIFGSGGSDVFGINGRGARAIAFGTNNTERMRITSGGNVGIGTTSPSSGISSTETTLQIQNGNVAALALNNSASRKYTIYSGVGGQLGFYDVTGGAERITLSSSGNVGIGTTSPSAKLDVNGDIKTGEPDTGYGRAAFKIGSRQSGSATGTGGYIPINIDGTIYFINLYTSTP